MSAPESDTSTPTSERQWLAHVYRPGQPQLTLRAIGFGIAIGALMCMSNLYVFFKTGWSIGVTLTAAILAFAVFRGLGAIGIIRRPLTALESNALTTVASGAGYMTAGGNMAAFGALLMITTMRPATLPLIAWFAVIAALGVFAAIPIKRQLINKEGLAFPTGTATAAIIRNMHGDDKKADLATASRGVQAARALAYAGGFGAIVAWLRDGKASWMPFNLPAAIPLPLTILGKAAKEWTLTFKMEVVLLGAGALMSFKTGWSLLLGGVLTYGVLAPSLFEQHVLTATGYKAIVAWTLWPGASILVASGLTTFVLDWRSIARSFSGLGRMFEKNEKKEEDPLADVECPGSWFPTGFVVLGPIVVFLMVWLFHIPAWAGVIAVPLAVIMGFVAARVTGETDVTPTKALGPVTQLLFGVLCPGNIAGNIMSANVTGGIGLHAADLLTTLKTGWLLGASPRAQFFAQLFGVVAGAAIMVPAFHVLIPDPATLGSETWPAPSCLVWAGVSQAFAGGAGALHRTARTAIGVGLLLGVVLSLLERFAPPRLKPWVPSPSGLGIAMVIPASNAIAMFMGTAGAEFARRRYPRVAERYLIPVSSGLIAGESLMGVVVALLVVAGVLAK